MIFGHTGTFTLAGRSSEAFTLNTAGKQFNSLTFAGYGGKYTLASDLTVANSIAVTAGGFVTASYPITSPFGFASTGSIARSIDIAGSTINVTNGTSAKGWEVADTGLTMTEAMTAGSTIAFQNTTTANLFAGGTKTYNNITIAAGSGTLTVSGSFTFANMTMSSAGTKTITFTAGNSYTMTGTNFLTGNGANLITIRTTVGGTPVTFTKSGGGTVACEYLDITDINVAPAATYFYGDHSAWHSGTGWSAGSPGEVTVPDPPTIGTAYPDEVSAYVSFTPPGNTGGSPITSYTVTSTPGGITANGASSEILITGLTNNVSYTFTVHATNIAGDSAESASSNAILPGEENMPHYFNILSTGQSLAMGFLSEPPISTTQPYHNLMLTSSVTGTSAPLIPLIETVVTAGTVETISSGMANSLYAYDSLLRPIVVSQRGANGGPYSKIQKGGEYGVYEVCMAQAATIKSEIESSSYHGIYNPLGVTVIHGETDYSSAKASEYEGYLVDWQSDFEGDLNILNGSSDTIPLYINQMNSGWTGELAVAQLSAHIDHPGKIILVEPKYQYHYRSDLLHIDTPTHEKHMGEMFAKVMKKVVLEGQTWDPLRPSSVIRADNVVRVNYHIPVGSLAIDTTTVAQRPNYGFEFTQTGGNAVTISSVELEDNNTRVKITLSDTPTGTNQHIRYAWSCYNGVDTWCAQAGESTSVGGNIRDTDSSVSPEIGSTGLPLYDWGVTFDQAVTADTTAPTVPGTPTTSSPTSNNKPTWTWTASTDTESGLANPAYTLQWSTDPTFASGVNSSTSNTNSFTHSSSLADGTWYFRAKATDNATNSSAYSSSGSMVVSTSVAPTPTPTPTPTSTPTESSTATATATATESPAAESTVSPSALSQWFPWLTGSSSATFTIPTDITDIEIGEAITFDASSLGSDIVKYEWDFGDGSTSSGRRVSHTYTTPGRYTVTLTVTDKSGEKSTISKTIDIRPPAPTISNIIADGANIIISGESFPKTTVNLLIHSNPYTAEAIADSSSKFSYTLENASEALGEGDHTILASAAVILSDNTQLKGKDSKTYDFKVSVDDGKLKVEMGKTKTWKTVSIILGVIIVVGIAGFVLYRVRRRIKR
jgi:PKD repeat protein